VTGRVAQCRVGPLVGGLGAGLALGVGVVAVCR
jgi:hypothetical protein